MANQRAAARVLVALLIAVSTCACVRRDGRNSDCRWPGEPAATSLDPRDPAASRHLSADTEFAEELADRYTNAHFGPRSGYAGPPRAGIERHNCMVKMFNEVARTHNISTDAVAATFGNNRLGIDLAEILSFAILFAAAAIFVSRRVWKRYPPSEGWPAGIVVILLTALAFGVGGYLVGEQWTLLAENLRVGTGHLGPRVMRLPMERYSMLVFASGIGLFLMLAVLFRPSSANSAPPSD